MVRHELLVSVKGGPMKGLSLDGIDPDADPLPDAQVVSVAEGRQGAPLPLLLHRSDTGTLSVEIDSEQGVRRGSFLFGFSYRTDLRGRGLILRQNKSAIVRWVGPRFDEGIAEAKVIFRLPTSDVAPAVPDFNPSDVDGAMGEGLGGLFTTGVRRVGDHDELELARAHVARGEPVVWRAAVGVSALPFLNTTDEPKAATVTTLQGAPARRAPERAAWLIGAALCALVFSGLVGLKSQLVARMSLAEGVAPLPLLPLSTPLRAAVGGIALASAVLLAGLTLGGTLAGLCLLMAGLSAVWRTPRRAATPRGPGRWLPMRDEEAWREERTQRPGAWLDAGRPQGALLLALMVLATSAACWKVAAYDLTRSVELALAMSAFVPLFLSGRLAQLPLPLAQVPRALFRGLAPKLRRQEGVRVAALGRFALGARDPDELRLVVTPRAALDGFVTMEIAVEVQEGPAGRVEQPRVLVRVKEDSPAQRAFPRSVLWTRGRRADERVAILTPKLPNHALLLGLVERVAALLAAEVQVGSSKPRKSSGKGSVTLKPSMVPLPLHAS